MPPHTVEGGVHAETSTISLLPFCCSIHTRRASYYTGEGRNKTAVCCAWRTIGRNAELFRHAESQPPTLRASNFGCGIDVIGGTSVSAPLKAGLYEIVGRFSTAGAVSYVLRVKVGSDELLVEQGVAPDNAIGRISRMDAIVSKSVNEGLLQKSCLQLILLENALAMWKKKILAYVYAVGKIFH